jgi:hypothetical protein
MARNLDLEYRVERMLGGCLFKFSSKIDRVTKTRFELGIASKVARANWRRDLARQASSYLLDPYECEV